MPKRDKLVGKLTCCAVLSRTNLKDAPKKNSGARTIEDCVKPRKIMDAVYEG